MKKFNQNSLISQVFLGVSSFMLTGFIYADSQPNAARLSFIDGTVTFSPAGSEDWVNATLNRPLVSGDRLWNDAGAKSELQYNDSAIRMGENTSINALNLANKTAQIQLALGSVCLHIKSVDSDQIYEVDTPNLAFSVLQEGDYRISVSADGKTTTITVHNGESQVSSQGASYKIEANQSYKISGTDLSRESVTVSEDDFDHWCSDRNSIIDKSTSSQYVSSKMTGAGDLDNNGNWSTDTKYGKVWQPSNVPNDWVPYSTGHWVWIGTYGWTWVDDNPWAYTTSHYGYWTRINGRWVWVPGNMAREPVFIPALVGFLNGLLGPNGPLVAWFPLGPDVIYQPTYVNIYRPTNTYVNIYNIPPQTYVNGGITAIPTNGMIGSQPVDPHSMVPVTTEMLNNTKVTNNPAVTPSVTSLLGGLPPANVQFPPSGWTCLSDPKLDISHCPVMAKNIPPSNAVPFSSQLPLLNKHPGIPLNPKELKSLNPGKPNVTIVSSVTAPQTSVAHPPSTMSQVPVHPPIKVTPKKKVKAAPVHPKVKTHKHHPKVYRHYYPPKSYYPHRHHGYPPAYYPQPQNYYPQQPYYEPQQPSYEPQQNYAPQPTPSSGPSQTCIE